MGCQLPISVSFGTEINVCLLVSGWATAKTSTIGDEETNSEENEVNTAEQVNRDARREAIQDVKNGVIGIVA